MDFLDPKKQRLHKILLICGYLLIACIVGAATTILLYEAYGFGLGKGGTIIQNGLLYLSSQPNPATIYINGRLSSSTTNTSMTLPEGIYNVKLTRSGYRTWDRNIEVDGGTIESYTYPLLIPTRLFTSSVKSYSAMPSLATQSPDRRWLLVQLPNSNNTFDLYDLSNPALAPTQVSIPGNIVTSSSGVQSWKLVAWSTDNQHVLVEHTDSGKVEYIMIDIANPSQSFNLSQQLNGVSFTAIALDNGHYDQYYLYNNANDTLSSDILSSPTTPTVVLNNVISYDAYNGNTYLYVTNSGAPAGKVFVNILAGGNTYRIKTLPAGTNYILNMAGYNGSVYVVAGAASDNKVYIYNDPVSQLQADPKQAPVPVQVLLVNNPTIASFSDNAQFIAAEGNNQFAVYNIENSSGYNYTVNMPLDAPQTSASWMDVDRMTYVSGGKLLMFEYDHNYQQLLMPASPNYLPFFTPSYNYVYTLTPGSNSTYLLTRTSLYTPADQPQKL
ncbi:MAG: PEGA domain-containing protein [Candidatus Saccharimonadales bacterium]